MGLDFDLVLKEDADETCVHEAYITHNVAPMWRLAGIYDALYNSNGQRVSDVVETLRAGLAKMEASPEEYLPLNPPNGWGSYESAKRWLSKLVAACDRFPIAVIESSK